jgi:hydroxymethylpyrimidine/phosphomethylpyrimidine kinase
VMVAKGGHRLLLSEAEIALRERLLPRAALLTPNLPEAEVLAGFPVHDEASMKRAAEKLVSLGARAVLMKGGHLAGNRVIDLLLHGGKFDRFEDARIESRSTHGTGCTLASAIAAGLAQQMSLRDAVARARSYVRDAIASAPDYGKGHGPLNHAVTIR